MDHPTILFRNFVPLEAEQTIGASMSISAAEINKIVVAARDGGHMPRSLHPSIFMDIKIRANQFSIFMDIKIRVNQFSIFMDIKIIFIKVINWNIT